MIAATKDAVAGNRRTARQPGRTCVACGRLAPAAELMRVTALPEGGLVLDWRRRLGGRGAWVCAERGCIERAVRERRFDRVLRARPDYPAAADLVAAAREACERRIDTLLQSARGAGALLAGTDAVAGGLARGVVRFLLLAEDAAAGPAMLDRAGRAWVPAAAGFDKRRLGELLRRPDTGVIGITDAGLARALGNGMAGLERLR